MPRGLLERATDIIALSVDPLDGDSIDWSRGPDPNCYNSDYYNHFDSSNSSLSSALFDLDSLGDYTDGQFTQPSSGNGTHRAEPTDTSPLSHDSSVWQQPADTLSDEQWAAMCGDTPGIQLGGRLAQFVDAYEQAGAWAFLVDWLRNGIMLPFYNAVPPPRIRLENHTSATAHHEWVTQQVAALLQSGAITPFSDPHCVSPLGVAIRERDGKKRLVLDNRFINMFIVCVTFRMERLDLLSRIIAAGEYMFSADLRSGYHHVPVHEDFWTFLGFTWEGVSYAFKVLPFGLSLSPFVFSKITRWVMKYFRTSHQLPGSVYIDDFLFSVGLDYGHALKVIPSIVKTFRHFGWIVAADKSHRIPTTRIQHLGMMVDSVARCFQAPESRLISVENKLKLLLKSADGATFRLIAQALGSLVALTPAVGPVNIYSVDIMTVFNSTKKNNRSSWDQRVPLSVDAVVDVKFWLDRIRRANGSAIWPPDRVVTILSDAGDQGYGGTLRMGGTILDKDVTGTWKRSEVTKSSTWREMKAVIHALRHFEKDVRGKSVLIITDNSANASCLTKKNCKALGLIPLLRETYLGSWDRRVLNGHWLLFVLTLGASNAQVQSEEISRLTEAASLYSAEQYQESTKKQQQRAFQKWSNWCMSLNFDPDTPPQAALRLFATHLCVDMEYKADTVWSMISHINAVLRSKGIRPIEDPSIKGLLLGKKRSDEVPAKQATPIFPSDVSRIASLLKLTTRGKRDFAIMTVGIAGFLRPSEIVKLKAEDLDFAADYSGMRILLRNTKTDRLKTGQ